MLTCSLGTNRKSPRGTRYSFAAPHDLAALLTSRKPDAEHWWSPYCWTGDLRSGEAWESACAVAIDLDYHDDTGAHAVPPDDVRQRLGEARLSATLRHETPRGERLILVFDSLCTDADAVGAALDGALVRARQELDAAGLPAPVTPRDGPGTAGVVVDGAVRDRARILFCPRALVPSDEPDAEGVVQPRDAQVRVCGLLTPIGDLLALVKPPPPPASIPQGPRLTDERPGDAFNRQASWGDVLEPHGWRIAGPTARDGNTPWTRPGKDSGTSATTNETHCYVFTSSTCLEPNRSYLKFTLYAALNHGGDLSAAARELAGKGFGSHRPSRSVPSPLAQPSPGGAVVGPASATGATSRPGEPPAAAAVAGELDRLDGKPIYYWDPGSFDKAIVFALDRLQEESEVFQRSGRLVMVARYSKTQDEEDVKRHEGQPVIVPISGGRIKEMLCRGAWLRFDARNERWKPSDPPDSVVKDLVERYDYPGIRPLDGISSVPIIREDGSIWDAPGYDHATRYLYAPFGKTFCAPIVATHEMARQSYRELLEVIEDFPFVDQHHRSVWVSCLLSVVGWNTFKDGAPMHMFDANGSGTGKTKCADCVSLIARGVEAASIPPGLRNEELEKRLTACVISGDTIVMFDNLKNGSLFGDELLDMTLTRHIWKGRRLGESENVELPMNIVWISSGNNIGVRADAARRVLRARIESPLDNPGVRKPEDFHHWPLESWVLDERARLVSAAQVILKAYIDAGKPRHGRDALGSYDGWDTVIRGAIIWATDGDADPVQCSCLHDPSADPDAESHRKILHAWRVVDGPVTASQLLAEMNSRGGIYSELRTAIEETIPGRNGRVELTAKSIGYALRKIKGKWRSVDGQQMAIGAKNGKLGQTWFLMVNDGKNDAGDARGGRDDGDNVGHGDNGNGHRGEPSGPGQQDLGFEDDQGVPF
jgi:hypothetical protein